MDFFTLKNRNGMRAVISDLGGVLAELHVPDRSGTFRDVVLGYADPKDYLENPYHFGAVIGRYANRIKGGRFEIDGREYRLPRNNASGDCQHGGIRGFHLHIFEVSALSEDSITLRRISPDGEEGFPGALLLEVTYSLTGDNTLRMGYRAECDAPTILNPTNHSYFNLNGHDSGSVGTHFVGISASRMLECDSDGIPNGRILYVTGTPFDLRKECLLAERLNADLPELKSAGGFDVIYLPDNSRGAAIVYAPESGIEMKLDSQLALDEYAVRIGLSPRQIERIVKKHFGVSFGQYVRARRLEAAKNLLRSPFSSIKGVANSLGFDDVSYFCRIFRHAVGVTPGKYAINAQLSPNGKSAKKTRKRIPYEGTILSQ